MRYFSIKALQLYRSSLERFMVGMKYEKNEARKNTILERVEGYMKRAEELSDYIKKKNELEQGGSGEGAATLNKSDKEGENSMDKEKEKLRGALSSAIVSEKPNIKWEDVAGLGAAKEALKETVILVSYNFKIFISRGSDI